MHVELKPIDSIIPYARNPRKNDAAVATVAASIEEFGWQQPVVVDKDNVVVAGHTRLLAARQLGLNEIPVHIATSLSDAQIKAYRLLDNKSHEMSSWDLELLPLELQDLTALDIDLALTGFSDEEINELLADPGTTGLCDPNEEPQPPDEPISTPGDLWLLGDARKGHRLLCGDSTDAAQVRRLMDGKRAALFATDPPYLVDYDGTNHPHKWGEAERNKDWSDTYSVSWDDADANPELYDRFIEVAIAEAIKPSAAWYCWHASRRQAMLEAVWTKHGAFVHQQIIWSKDRPILTRSWYMWQHEPCFMGWIKGQKPPRVADDHPRSIWNIPTVAPGTRTDHPTSKPVELFAIPMRQHTKRGNICYEPFAGSGSQIIAAEQLGRRCFAMEISPAYVDVCVARWEKFTGGKAERADNGGGGS